MHSPPGDRIGRTKALLYLKGKKPDLRNIKSSLEKRIRPEKTPPKKNPSKKREKSPTPKPKKNQMDISREKKKKTEEGMGPRVLQ